MTSNLFTIYHKKAVRVALVLSCIPFTRMIAINGSLASGKITKNSDIDFFIITQQNRLWLTRLLITLILDLGLLRAKKNSHRGKICLNHLLTNEKYLLNRQDDYNAYQYSHLIVLYSTNNTYQEFIKKNQWMNKYYKNCGIIESIKSQNQLVKRLFEKILFNWFGDFIENVCRAWQVWRIKHNSFFHQKDSVLMISDQEFYYYTKVSRKYHLWGK
ncbi:MAG: hypothetical protein ACD_58C00025G0002 [uncultured bacterium]|nr:MAG: hypothetical protein ACD_58C00025G0002 [uncultured bacterium]